VSEPDFLIKLLNIHVHTQNRKSYLNVNVNELLFLSALLCSVASLLSFFLSRPFYPFPVSLKYLYYLLIYLIFTQVLKFYLHLASGRKGNEKGRTLRTYILNLGIKQKWVVKIFTFQPL
jgi:hypothetical protein